VIVCVVIINGFLLIAVISHQRKKVL